MKEIKISEIENKIVHGRGQAGENGLPLFNHGSGLEIIATGSECFVEYYAGYRVHEPWVIIELNGAIVSRMMLPCGENQRICLFRNMTPGVPKRIRLFRENQAMSEDPFCMIVLKKVITDGELAPIDETQMYSHKLEFIGDSLTSGEGSFGASEETDWIPVFMGLSHAFPYYLSRKMNAMFQITSHGGWGVVNSWDNNRKHAVPRIYTKVSGFTQNADDFLGDATEQSDIVAAWEFGADREYDFSLFSPDAVIINLGTNDATSYFPEIPEWTDPVTGSIYKNQVDEKGLYNKESIGDFVEGVISFLKLVRQKRPDAYIVWCYGMLGYKIGRFICEGINRYVDETGDARVEFIQLQNTTPDMYGSHQHSGKEAHKRVAALLAEYLDEVLNQA